MLKNLRRIRNPVSYDIGISVIRNVLTAVRKLKENPQDSDARGVAESADKMVDLFGSLGVDMYFDGEVSVEAVKEINIATLLSADEVTDIVRECLR